jgi:Fic family protein
MNYLGAPAEDCAYLLATMCDWLNGPDFEPQSGFDLGHMAILKAIIAHLYIEWIHAFGDGNGRTGRLIEAQILLAAGIPAPASQLLSNHYNQTRREYYTQLRDASGSGGDAVPFICYGVAGLLSGLKSQLQRIRRVQMETAWINYVHDFFRSRTGATASRQKLLLLDLLREESPVEISNVDKISPGTAKQYAGMHTRTKVRDIESLEQLQFIVREGNKVRANIERITAFLPIRATRSDSPQPASSESALPSLRSMNASGG